MPAPTIENTFIEEFEAEVHVAYQRMGSKLRNTIRSKPSLGAKRVYFPKYGTFEAKQKPRHADIEPQNADHSRVYADMADYVAGDYIDNLDELKTNIAERQLAAQGVSGAFGRKIDEIATTVMDGATNTIVHGSTGLTATKINTVYAAFGNNDVPNDGRRFFPVSPEGWLDLLAINAFTQAEYVGYDQLPYRAGMTAKRWLSFMFFEFSGMPIASTTRKTFAYHYSAVGVGYNSEPSVDIDWIAQKRAWLVAGDLSLGGTIIDNTGLYEVQYTE